ncbi:LPS assembly lipoprotein LptE [Oceanibacterium hippocampi]|uniref:LPS-assembly lipoprotein n=1 Tax=Oceanibacterium hippocampi TaxID=745714 RepID=A0A1Y5RLS0_9PROT|nr:LPS assembly lipoprotein LptE [Oceanibacterium hippocampi]SLN20423.1 hypothetical protein OCH7691_00498 [Oceanibacterium hippocampi]
MSWSRRQVLGALALLPLGACGFQPLYGERGIAGGKVAPLLGAIKIQNVSIAGEFSRFGFELQERLIDRLTPKGQPAAPLYALKVDAAVSRSNLLIQLDNTVRRRNLTIRANFELVDLSDNKVVYSSQTRALSSYNIVDSDFANLISERDAGLRAAKSVSEEITIQLASHFSRVG